MNKKSIRRTEIWKFNRTIFLLGRVCMMCGSCENLVPHHTVKCQCLADYVDMRDAIPLCQACHFHFEIGFRRCVLCNTEYLIKDHWSPEFFKVLEKYERMEPDQARKTYCPRCYLSKLSPKRGRLIWNLAPSLLDDESSWIRWATHNYAIEKASSNDIQILTGKEAEQDDLAYWM